MLLDKYTPKSTKEVIGNSAAIAETKRFLTNWKKGRALLVHGPTGTAKSTALRLIAQELGYELLEIHANEKRAANSFLLASAQQSIFSKKKLLLFEDIETMPMRGFTDLINKSEHPIVCTINDAYQLARQIRKNFKIVKFDKINEPDLLRFAENICKKESIICERRHLEQLVKTSNGDIRSLLIDLETLRLGFKHSGYRDLEENIFNTLKIIFKTISMENAKIAMRNSEKDPQELFQWLNENIAEEYTDVNTIAVAYDYLSKADIFYSRIIRRQSWGLEKYFSSLAVYGTSLAKTRPSVRFVPYKSPLFSKRINESLLGKIANNLHISKRHAAIYIPVIRMLARKNSDICEDLGMDEKEAAVIIGE